MQIDAFLITRPAIDFHTFLDVGQKVMGYSLAVASDASSREVADAEQLLRLSGCDPSTKGDPWNRLPDCSPTSRSRLCSSRMTRHARYSGVLRGCRLQRPKRSHGNQVAVVSGTMTQWRDAVKAGSFLGEEVSVRQGFDRIRELFCHEGLDVWTDSNVREAPDRITYYLEDNRKQ